VYSLITEICGVLLRANVRAVRNWPQRCMCNFLDVGQVMYYPCALSTVVSDSVRNIVFPVSWTWLSHCHATNFKSGEVRQCNVTWHLGAFALPLFPWIINEYYIFWVCFCCRRYPACPAHAPYYHLCPVRIYHIFPRYLITTRFSKRKLLNIKCVWIFLYKFSLKHHSKKIGGKYCHKVT
jgi:hypothetical protein